MGKTLLERKKRYYKNEMGQPLAYALWSAGKMAFEPESVEKYMKRKVWQFRISEKEISISFLLSLIVIGVTVMGCLGLMTNQLLPMFLPFCLLLISFILFKHCALTTPIDVEKLTRKEKIGVVSTVALFLLGGGWLAFAVSLFYGPKTKEWIPFLLKHYDKSKLPPFALETVEEVKMRCPQAEFVVFELKDNDPILWVGLEEEKYYIEAWSEPNFKGKRLA